MGLEIRPSTQVRMLALPTLEARSTPGGSSQSPLQKEVMETSPNTAGDIAGSPESGMNCLSQNRFLGVRPLDRQPHWPFAASKISIPTVYWETWLCPPALTLLMHFPAQKIQEPLCSHLQMD